MKYTPWKNYSQSTNPYALYAGQRYQKTASAASPAGTNWAKVLWPNGWLLIPAWVGIGGAGILGFALSYENFEKDCLEPAAGSRQKESDNKGSAGGAGAATASGQGFGTVRGGKEVFIANVYTLIATAGISCFVLENLFSVIGQFWLTLSTIVVGTLTAALLFASVYFYVNQVNSESFSQTHLGSNVFAAYYSFVYLSVTTITVGGFGDIVPLTPGSRTLIMMEVLFYLFILSSGVAAFSQVKSR